MKVLITGGAGFIGSHVAERMLQKGNEVLVIDNYETGRKDNLTPQKGLTIVEGSIVDEKLMAKLFNEFRPEVVLHAAASYKDPENFIGDAQTNVAGTAVTVTNAKKAGVRKIVYLQTALCYGDPIEQPISLKHPIQPEKSSYSISKTGGEYYIRLSGLPYVTFRLANAYGPRNLSGPLPTFYSRLTSGKNCFVTDSRRDFVFVDDMVDVIEMALEGVGSGEYHLSSGGDYSIKELYDATIEALNMPEKAEVEVRPLGPDDVFTILLDPSRIKQDFGKVPSYPLKDGIRRTIEYYKKFGIQETFTHLKLEK